MIIVPNGNSSVRPGWGKALRDRLRRWRWVSYLFLLAGTFVAGAYVRARHWDWYWLAHTRVQSALAAAPDAPALYLESALHAEPLPLISLDMKFKHVAKIRAKRDQALQEVYLRTSDADFVPATLWCEGRSVPVKVRLKGDRRNHVSGDKWSFRIKVKGDERPFGMRTFSVQHPEMRRYLNEWSFLESVRRERILAVRYRFVRLVFNGVDKGIYALEEHFSKELLEAHGRREGVIVALEEQHSIHVDSLKRGWGWDDWDVGTRISAVESQHVRTFDTKHIEQDAGLRAQRDEAVELLRAYQEGRRKPSEVFDARVMGRYMALIDLWQAWHAVLWSNTRYYYNPITARLEPIGFDAMALWGDDDAGLVAASVDDRFINGPLRDPEIARVYLEELERVSRPEYLEELRTALQPEFRRWQLALRREFLLEPKLEPAWDKLARRQEYLRAAINTKRMVIATAVPETVSVPTGTGVVLHTVDVRTIAALPVEIVGFRVNGGPRIPAAAVWRKRRQDGVWRNDDGSVGICPMDGDRPLILATFTVPVPPSGEDAERDHRPTIEVATRFPGQSHSALAAVRLSPPRSDHGSRPQTPTAQDALDQHPFLERTVSGDFRVRAGTWDVNGDLILPRDTGLEVGPGTTLRFEPDAALCATSLVCLRGAPGREVVLEARDGRWGGVVVVEAGVESVWEDVIIRSTTSVRRGGWMLTGGVTFYKSAARMTRVTFRSSMGEDALNVVHARSVLTDCAFVECGSDAFDGDFVTGRLERCRFEDVAGDAVDVSGSTIAIHGLSARRVTDKVISAGEHSTVTVRDLDVDHAGIAVAAKDSSATELLRATIRHARIGLAAYVKKAVFGPARITAEHVEFTDTSSRALVQTGSSVLLDGVEQPAAALDVRALYAERVLGN